jgi:hypothetical protein
MQVVRRRDISRGSLKYGMAIRRLTWRDGHLHHGEEESFVFDASLTEL